MYLIPKPKQIEKKEGCFYMTYQSGIVINPTLEENSRICAMDLKKEIEKWAGMRLLVQKGLPQSGDIYLTLDAALGSQAYRLTITEEGIVAAGGDGAGVRYAVQTLCQIIEQCGGSLMCMQIEDAPKLLHRGYFLDETRGRVLKLDYLKKVVDRLSRYKLNEFQLYIEHTYLFRDLSEMWRDETPLTAEEIMELDAYCKERYIELVPSLASFGHLYTLLSTKSYGDLCEFSDAEKQPFSFDDRMHHHTINAADDRTLLLIEHMLEEYMALFSSNKFNICADETFDLGKGKTRKLAEEKGVHRIYIDYVKALCEFLVEKGKQPMFWGDIICGEPKLVQELPENTICLNWGYAPDQIEEPTRKMAETGVQQYLCPGVAGWNQWMNLLENSYLNIVRMCSFARKYHAVGILNTDWGDFGHINQPEFSVPGMIYGAAFSWNWEEIPFEEINRQISKVEYHDTSEKLVSLMAQISKYSACQWYETVMYYEHRELSQNPKPLKLYAKVQEANPALEGIRKEIMETMSFMDAGSRGLMQQLDVVIDGIEIWNQIGDMVIRMDNAVMENAEGVHPNMEERYALAKQLESWFMAYKELWRSESREGDLHHIAEIVFWYADLLRERKREKRRNQGGLYEC